MSGITILNESECEIMACLSQLSPLHWTDKIAPGSSKTISCGRVWFTLSVGAYDAKAKPTRTMTATRLTVITASALLTGPFWLPALVVTSVASGYTSTVAGTANKKRVTAPGDSFKVRGAVKKGVFANDRTYVVRGVHRPDGVYELFFDKWSRADGQVEHLCRRKPAQAHAPAAEGYVEYSQLVVEGSVVEPPPSYAASSAPPQQGNVVVLDDDDAAALKSSKDAAPHVAMT